ncbi:MAG TPA: TIGR03086 family metal-binding protein [Pseudonocardia sp.]|jgi:uncharacterized protein (TIGR03086 family)
MTNTYDLGPSVEQLSTLLTDVTDEQLDAPTPCAGFTVRDLIGHTIGFAVGFRGAALKAPPTGTPPENPADLVGPDWRAEVPIALGALAQAWRDPAAWEGGTAAAGVDLPADLAGMIALNEVVLHSWDLAKATGQPFHPDAAGVEASLRFTTLVNSPEWPNRRDRIFGDVVAVPEDADDLDRTLGLSGRDPSWTR